MMKKHGKIMKSVSIIDLNSEIGFDATSDVGNRAVEEQESERHATLDAERLVGEQCQEKRPAEQRQEKRPAEKQDQSQEEQDQRQCSTEEQDQRQLRNRSWLRLPDFYQTHHVELDEPKTYGEAILRPDGAT